MKRKLLWFLVNSLAVWAVAAWPAWLLQGEQGILEISLALLLCLVPMTATLLWCGWAMGGSPEDQLAAVMGGSGLRLIFVLVAGVLIHQAVPVLRQDSFLLWVIFFYLATLAVEVILMVRTAEKNLPVKEIR